MYISDRAHFKGDALNAEADVLVVGMQQGCLVPVCNVAGLPHTYYVQASLLVPVHT